MTIALAIRNARVSDPRVGGEFTYRMLPNSRLPIYRDRLVDSGRKRDSLVSLGVLRVPSATRGRRRELEELALDGTARASEDIAINKCALSRSRAIAGDLRARARARATKETLTDTGI